MLSMIKSSEGQIVGIPLPYLDTRVLLHRRQFMDDYEAVLETSIEFASVLGIINSNHP